MPPILDTLGKLLAWSRSWYFWDLFKEYDALFTLTNILLYREMMVVRRRYNRSKSYRCYNRKNSPMASLALSSSYLLPHLQPTPAFIHHEDMSVSQVNHASQVFPSFPLHLFLENSFYTSSIIKESFLLGSFPVIYIWLLATCPHSGPIF